MISKNNTIVKKTPMKKPDIADIKSFFFLKSKEKKKLLTLEIKKEFI